MRVQLTGFSHPIVVAVLCVLVPIGCDAALSAADADADGDGVANAADDFPSDPGCAVRDDDNCAGCGLGCAGQQFCGALGACLCEDRGYTGPGCDEAIVAAGSLVLGSPESEACREPDESLHTVTLTRSFAVKSTEVTQAEWEAEWGTNPSSFTGCARCPVEMVNWFSALAYCNALSERNGLAACYVLSDCHGEPGEGDFWCLDVTVTADEGTPYGCEGYRLPTGIEWEVAARAGTGTATYAGDIDADDCEGGATVLEPIAWYSENSGARPHPVGEKEANALGLHDMLGNVREWVWDFWYGAVAPGVPARDDIGSSLGSHRGCGWKSAPMDCRAARRVSLGSTWQFDHLGFRVVRTLP